MSFSPWDNLPGKNSQSHSPLAMRETPSLAHAPGISQRIGQSERANANVIVVKESNITTGDLAQRAIPRHRLVSQCAKA